MFKKKNSKKNDDVDLSKFPRYDKYSKIEVPEYIYARDSNQELAFDVNSNSKHKVNKFDAIAAFIAIAVGFLHGYMFGKAVYPFVQSYNNEPIMIPSELNYTIYDFLVINGFTLFYSGFTFICVLLFNVAVLNTRVKVRNVALPLFISCCLLNMTARFGMYYLTPTLFDYRDYIVTTVVILLIGVVGVYLIMKYLLGKK